MSNLKVVALGLVLSLSILATQMVPDFGSNGIGGLSAQVQPGPIKLK